MTKMVEESRGQLMWFTQKTATKMGNAEKASVKIAWHF